MRLARALLTLALVLFAALAQAQDTPSAPAKARFGTFAAPPFAMRGEDGAWEGISVDLFTALAARLDLDYELVVVDPATMVEDVASGRLDGAIGPLAVTAANEAKIDFTHPYFRADLGVAEQMAPRPRARAIYEALITPSFLATLGMLNALMFVAGTLAWLAERRRNPGQFEPDMARGLFSGFWWAATTMTTTGYGDKAPITLAGRIIGILWMIYALILIALVTAQLSASLTAERISSKVTSVAELAHVRVGYVTGTASLAALRALGSRPTGYADTTAGLTALSKSHIDAFVDDTPVLRWTIGTVEGVTLAPLRFAPEDLAFILPNASPDRDQMNQALLDILASDQWTVILRLYLGTDQ